MTLTAAAVAAPALWSAETITATTADGRTVSVTAVSPNILRVDNFASDQQTTGPQTVIEPEDATAARTEKLSGSTIMTTASGLRATIDTGTGRLIIESRQPGSLVCDPGSRSVAGGRQTLELLTTSTGSFYGAGERGHKLNLRGDTLTVYNRQNYGYTGSDPRISQMNISMPLFLSNDGFAIVFDDHAAAEMILGNPIVYTTESRRPVSYYYIGGVSDMAGLTEQLTSLTGRQELPPFWALGYITSKYGYRDQKQTLAVVDTLKRLGYPLDGLVLDLYWFGKEEDMGRLDWDRSLWPDPKKMLSGLKKKGVNIITVSEPYVLRNGRAIDNYNELAPKGMFVRDSNGNPHDITIWVGEGGMFDVSNPDTRQWLRNRYKYLTDLGVSGWWGDLGEPEVHPETAVHYNGMKAREYHNIYGNDWSSIIYDLFKQEYPDRRLMTLMRGGTTGLQRYSVFPWSTDVSRSWGGLEPQVRIMLNSGLSGLGYMSHDIGGFAVDPEHAFDPELYVRWLQLGLFTPVFRTHSTRFAEPYQYPDQASIIEPLIKERYRWLPYNYTLAYENATKGWPIVRPLDFHNADADGSYDAISDEFLWGRDVLVAPVMTPGVTERSVTFPKGSDWVDFYNPNERFAGGYTVPDYPAPLEKLPLFIRCGAFIPMADYKMDNTGDYRSDRFTVNYYPAFGVSSDFSLYDDNRISPSTLADRQYRLINFKGDMAGNGEINVEISSEGTYTGAPRQIDLRLVVHCLPSGSHSATIEGAKGNVEIDTRKGIAYVNIKYVPGTTVRFNLRLVPGPRR